MNEVQTQRAAKRLSIASLQMASRVCPTGYDVDDDAPESLGALTEHIRKTGRMRVWKGASDRTVFQDAEVNWAARAWHDWTHYVTQEPFTLLGEIAVAQRQAADLTMIYGKSLETAHMVAVLFAEVIGQARFKQHTGAFPEDQRQYVLNVAPGYLDMARKAVLEAVPA